MYFYDGDHTNIGTMYLHIFVEFGKLMLLYWMLEMKYRPVPSFKKDYEYLI